MLPNIGIIKLRRNPPPNLKGPQYTLNITAIDDNASGGPTPLSSFAEVIVGVNDINNNKPVFREVRCFSCRYSFPIHNWGYRLLLATGGCQRAEGTAFAEQNESVRDHEVFILFFSFLSLRA